MGILEKFGITSETIEKTNSNLKLNIALSFVSLLALGAVAVIENVIENQENDETPNGE